MKKASIEVDEKKVAMGLKATGLSSLKELVDVALSELLRRERLKGILKLRGKVRFFENYDPSALRRSRR